MPVTALGTWDLAVAHLLGATCPFCSSVGRQASSSLERWSEDRGGLAWPGTVFLRAAGRSCPLRRLPESLVPGSEPAPGRGPQLGLAASCPFFVPRLKTFTEHLLCAQLRAAHRDPNEEQESSQRKPCQQEMLGTSKNCERAR